jgi:hypothetical protein
MNKAAHSLKVFVYWKFLFVAKRALLSGIENFLPRLTTEPESIVRQYSREVQTSRTDSLIRQRTFNQNCIEWYGTKKGLLFLITRRVRNRSPNSNRKSIHRNYSIAIAFFSERPLGFAFQPMRKFNKNNKSQILVSGQEKSSIYALWK